MILNDGSLWRHDVQEKEEETVVDCLRTVDMGRLQIFAGIQQNQTYNLV